MKYPFLFCILLLFVQKSIQQAICSSDCICLQSTTGIATTGLITTGFATTGHIEGFSSGIATGGWILIGGVLFIIIFTSVGCFVLAVPASSGMASLGGTAPSAGAVSFGQGKYRPLHDQAIRERNTRVRVVV
jgi:hypothetical protein